VAESLRCIGDKKTKHVLAPLDEIPGVISLEFSHLYFKCHPDPFIFGGDMAEKLLHEPPE